MTNLTTKSNAYSCSLNSNYKHLVEMFDKPEITTEALRQEILETTSSAPMTKAKQGFINNVMKCKTKVDLISIVTNSVMCAQHMSANVDYKWKNER